MRSPATNRQKKVLKFFGIQFNESISVGAAGWELGAIFADESNAEKWRKYLFLTKDFGAESNELLPFKDEDLEATNVPDDWSASKAIKVFREEMAASILASESPYDTPQPDIDFFRHSFCFTGKFDFGPRKSCEDVIREKGGIPAKGVSNSLDFLVIGTQGNPNWKRGSYGNKIEKAIVLRRENGKPAIVSEDHCFSFL